MPFFKYIGQSRNQELISGWIESGSLRLAAKVLTVAGGLKILEIQPANFHFINLIKRFKQVKDDDIYLMTRAFGALISSGVSTFESLKILFKTEDNDMLKGVLISILYDIRNGFSISGAMSKHPKIFSPVYLGMIRAGETTGTLDLMLRRLSNFLEREFRTKRMIRAALVYPAFVFLFCLGVAIISFYYILPALLGSIINVSASLPLPTRILYFLIKTGHNPYLQLAFISGLLSYLIFLKKWLNNPENCFQDY